METARKIDDLRIPGEYGCDDSDVDCDANRSDELDVAPADGGKMEQKRMDTSVELLQALDKSAADARAAFQNTSDEHLMTNWRLLARGNVVMEAPRHIMIQDTINHWTHHRGQMTVYLRLMGAKVPALYGPSADDNQFK